jgi:hypothetical protein
LRTRAYAADTTGRAEWRVCWSSVASSPCYTIGALGMGRTRASFTQLSRLDQGESHVPLAFLAHTDGGLPQPVGTGLEGPFRPRSLPPYVNGLLRPVDTYEITRRGCLLLVS